MQCEDACKNAKEAGRNDCPFYNTDFQYECPVCTCQCRVLFYRHDGKKLAVQSQKDREEKMNFRCQSKMDRFLGFNDSIVNQTKTKLVKLSSKSNTQDRSSTTVVDLVSSRSVQENVILRNEMQK